MSLLKNPQISQISQIFTRLRFVKIRDFTEKTAENAEIAEIYQKNPGKSAQSAAFFSELIRVIRGFFQ